MRTQTLFIPVGDEVISIGDMPIVLEGTMQKQRASHILPVNGVKRAAFKVLRRVFGETGRVADWTRRWRGPWYAEIIATGETFTHWDRQKCVDWELKRLEQLMEK